MEIDQSRGRATPHLPRWPTCGRDWPRARPRAPDISASVVGRLCGADWTFHDRPHPLPLAPTSRESRKLRREQYLVRAPSVTQGLEGGLRTGVMALDDGFGACRHWSADPGRPGIIIRMWLSVPLSLPLFNLLHLPGGGDTWAVAGGWREWLSWGWRCDAMRCDPHSMHRSAASKSCHSLPHRGSRGRWGFEKPRISGAPPCVVLTSSTAHAIIARHAMPCRRRCIFR